MALLKWVTGFPFDFVLKLRAANCPQTIVKLHDSGQLWPISDRFPNEITTLPKFPFETPRPKLPTTYPKTQFHHTVLVYPRPVSKGMFYFQDFLLKLRSELQGDDRTIRPRTQMGWDLSQKTVCDRDLLHMSVPNVCNNEKGRRTYSTKFSTTIPPEILAIKDVSRIC